MSSNETDFNLKDFCNIMQKYKICFKQFDTSHVIANILCKTYVPYSVNGDLLRLILLIQVLFLKLKLLFFNILTLFIHRM